MEKTNWISTTKAFLIDDTISKNIAFDLDFIDEKNKPINRKSQLSDLINRLPDGLNTTIGDRGIKLSGGEQQRIANCKSAIPWVKKFAIFG